MNKVTLEIISCNLHGAKMQQCLIPTALKPSKNSHLWCHLRLSSCKCKCMYKCIFALIYVRVYKTINDPVAYRVQSAHFVFIFSRLRLPTWADLYSLSAKLTAPYLLTSSPNVDNWTLFFHFEANLTLGIISSTNFPVNPSLVLDANNF